MAKLKHYGFCLVFATLTLLGQARIVSAQNIAGVTSGRVGNATAFPNSNYNSNPLTIDPAGGNGNFSSRHNRRNGATGIGGSFSGTESVTSESAPSIQPLYAPAVTSPATQNSVGSYSFYSRAQPSPALSGGFGGDVPETGTGLGNPVSTFNPRSSSTDYSGLDAIPSFNSSSVIHGYSHSVRSVVKTGLE
ncbi:MAG: hypothetical protein KGS72_16870 [Cyanobacteria bacterium REEB67]|nr:hypothetical protein [Cyanobacteria bacterium REEB67]